LTFVYLLFPIFVWTMHIYVYIHQIKGHLPKVITISINTILAFTLPLRICLLYEALETLYEELRMYENFSPMMSILYKSSWNGVKRMIGVERTSAFSSVFLKIFECSEKKSLWKRKNEREFSSSHLSNEIVK
jgi:hypothetical protein